MNEMPLTRISASAEKQEGIRHAVRCAITMGDLARLASPTDVDSLTTLLADPEISGPIYTLPEEICSRTIGDFVERHLVERQQGKGLLMISSDDAGEVSAYQDIQVWPQWAACELGGALRGNRQNAGQGGLGVAIAIAWLFDEIGVDLICETAALDNVRTARLLERIGFTFKGEIQSNLADGTVRPSLYWELTRDEWVVLSKTTLR